MNKFDWVSLVVEFYDLWLSIMGGEIFGEKPKALHDAALLIPLSWNAFLYIEI